MIRSFRGAHGGFSLVELLIALAVIAIAITALIRFTSTGSSQMSVTEGKMAWLTLQGFLGDVLENSDTCRIAFFDSSDHPLRVNLSQLSTAQATPVPIAKVKLGSETIAEAGTTRSGITVEKLQFEGLLGSVTSDGSLLSAPSTLHLRVKRPKYARASEAPVYDSAERVFQVNLKVDKDSFRIVDCSSPRSENSSGVTWVDTSSRIFDPDRADYDGALKAYFPVLNIDPARDPAATCPAGRLATMVYPLELQAYMYRARLSAGNCTDPRNGANQQTCAQPLDQAILTGSGWEPLGPTPFRPTNPLLQAPNQMKATVSYGDCMGRWASWIALVGTAVNSKGCVTKSYTPLGRGSLLMAPQTTPVLRPLLGMTGQRSLYGAYSNPPAIENADLPSCSIAAPDFSGAVTWNDALVIYVPTCRVKCE